MCKDMSGLVFDIETTGFPERAGWNNYYPPTDLSKYDKSRVVSASYAVLGKNYETIQSGSYVIKRNGFSIFVCFNFFKTMKKIESCIV